MASDSKKRPVVSNAPPPPREAGGSGYWISPRIQSRPGDPPRYDFPFPERSRSRVLAEMHRADDEFSREEQTRELTFAGRQALAIRWVCRIAGVFAGEACDLTESGAKNWEASKVESRVSEIVIGLVNEAGHSKFAGGSPQFAPERDTRAEIYRSTELLAYRQRLTALLDKAAACQPVSAGADPDWYATPLGRNIDRLRRDCGWSFDELAGEAGIAKTLILRHVNEGKRAYPGTLKKYADAFSENLKQNITPNDLLRDDPQKR